MMIMVKESNVEKKSTHIAGTFLVDAPASFLNGGGLGKDEYENYTIVKTFYDGRVGKRQYRRVFISSWKRWWRNTLIEETGWLPSKLRMLSLNAEKHTNKTGVEMNPIDFEEDDIFGFMFPMSNVDAAAAAKAEADEEATDESVAGLAELEAESENGEENGKS